MELSDLWNVKFGALWEPDKIKPLDTSDYEECTQCKPRRNLPATGLVWCVLNSGRFNRSVTPDIVKEIMALGPQHHEKLCMDKGYRWNRSDKKPSLDAYPILENGIHFARWAADISNVIKTCEDCEGTGQTEETCDACRGSGLESCDLHGWGDDCDGNHPCRFCNIGNYSFNGAEPCFCTLHYAHMPDNSGKELGPGKRIWHRCGMCQGTTLMEKASN